MKFSIYTSLFNYSPEKFDIRGAFENWFKYGDEIVVATFEDQKFQIEAAIKKEFGYDERIKIVPVEDTSLDDPFFDGKLKNAALQNCSNEIVILQDADERLSGEKAEWIKLGNHLLQYGPPCGFLIPTIDLYGDLDHYKSVGSKWYLTTKEGVFRGPVNFAKRSNGTIDTDRSDTTEAITKNGDLIPFFVENSFLRDGKNFNIKYCHSVHLGYLDLEKRVESNKFWKDIWSLRAGKNVEVAQSIEELEVGNISKKHNLKSYWWV